MPACSRTRVGISTFPRRDKGFDYIITREVATGVLVRPVQVKGLYPMADKGDKPSYGYGGRLTVLHPDMALVLVYFPPGAVEGTPQHIAYMPRVQVRCRDRGGYRCVPSRLRAGVVTPRRNFLTYFDAPGLAAMGQVTWA